MRPARLAGILLLPVLVSGGAAPQAAAQAVVACRDRNMQIVACASGSGGGGGSYSGGGTMPGAEIMGQAAYGMGYAIGTFLRSLMVDDTDYAALARQEQAREQEIARQRALTQDEQERWRRHELDRQQQFQSGQRDLLGQIRRLDGGSGAAVSTLGPKVETPAASGTTPPSGSAGLGVRQLDTSAPTQGALQQLQALDQNRPAMTGGSAEQAQDAASRGFDTKQAAGPAQGSLTGGPLMQVRGVPPVPQTVAPPGLPPAATTVTAADPLLQPMSLQQRLLIVEGRKAHGQLDALRQRRQRNEIDAESFEREETSLKGVIARLAQQFASAASPVEDTVSASAPSRPAPPSPTPPAGLNVMAAAAGDRVGSCQPSDPQIIGCIEIRNAGPARVRVYLHEVPGVFCTIEPGSMCSRPALQGIYNGFAERDDGRRTALATLLHTPAGVRWAVQF